MRKHASWWWSSGQLAGHRSGTSSRRAPTTNGAASPPRISHLRSDGSLSSQPPIRDASGVQTPPRSHLRPVVGGVVASRERASTFPPLLLPHAPSNRCRPPPSTLAIGRPTGISSRPLSSRSRRFFKPTQPRMPVHPSKGGNWHGTPTQHSSIAPGPEGRRSPPPPTHTTHQNLHFTVTGARAGMTATSRAPRRPRIRARGPPPAPTPIRTARGARSAAADERILAEFLETSLRVPDLALPPLRRKQRLFSFPPAAPPAPREVSSQALASGDTDAEAASAAAAESGGAFVVSGATDAREVREAVEASRAVFAATGEVKRELARWFPRRDNPVAGEEEFCWFWPVSSEDDRALGAALPGSTYRDSNTGGPVPPQETLPNELELS
nr:unnamed protein product [Digitaria exilis]